MQMKALITTVLTEIITMNSYLYITEIYIQYLTEVSTPLTVL